MPEPRDIVLCADDFGMAADIDDGILSLIERGRLSATGCMVAGPAFAVDAPRLRAHADRIDVGLHFCLSDLPVLGHVPSLGVPDGTAAELGAVLQRAFMGKLDYDEIRAEIARQVDRFHAVMGRRPAFVDGHQHVHVFPVVRRALFSLFDDGTLHPGETWIRDCADRPLGILKRGVSAPKTLFIAALSAGIARAARARGIATNTAFRGITDFSGNPPFADLARKFLADAPDGTLMMCHPASPALAAPANDPIAAARRREYAYLSGNAFLEDLADADVRLVPRPLLGR